MQTSTGGHVSVVADKRLIWEDLKVELENNALLLFLLGLEDKKWQIICSVHQNARVSVLILTFEWLAFWNNKSSFGDVYYSQNNLFFPLIAQTCLVSVDRCDILNFFVVLLVHSRTFVCKENSDPITSAKRLPVIWNAH